MINPNYQILWLLFVTAMADVHPSSGQINQYEQDMMIENDYRNTIAKTGLTGKRRPNRERRPRHGTEKRAGPKESQSLNVMRETAVAYGVRHFGQRDFTLRKSKSPLSGRKAPATSRGRGRGCCGSGYRHRDRRN